MTDTKGSPSTALIPASFISFDEACKQIALIENVEEVKEWRSRAAAFEKYAAAAKDYNLERQAYEIKERAEYRAGQILAEMSSLLLSRKPRNEVGDIVSPTLSAMGISKKESSRWQQKAKVPPEEFEKSLKEALSGSGRPKRNVIPINVKKAQELHAIATKYQALKKDMRLPIEFIIIDIVADLDKCLLDLKNVTKRKELADVYADYQRDAIMECLNNIMSECGKIMRVVKPDQATLKVVKE